MKKLLVILGPTATGKTDLALQLAGKFQGELVSVDSRQVYTGLDIGSGKLPSGRWKIEDRRWKKHRGFWEIGGIKVWMYDVVNFKKQYTVANYIKDTQRVIKDVEKRGKLPIIVGGTGLYLRGLLYGLDNLTAPVDVKLRAKLKKLSLNQLQKELQKISIPKWESMNNSDRQNPRRLVRAIELLTNKPTKQNIENLRNFDILKIGLIASRDILYKKVDQRVVARINQGMLDEAKILHQKGLSLPRMRELGLEYGVLADYLTGKIKTEIEFIKVLRGQIHGFVRRQLTWFKKEKDVFWFDISDKNYVIKIEKIMIKWYDRSDAEKNRYIT